MAASICLGGHTSCVVTTGICRAASICNMSHSLSTWWPHELQHDHKILLFLKKSLCEQVELVHKWIISHRRVFAYDVWRSCGNRTTWCLTRRTLSIVFYRLTNESNKITMCNNWEFCAIHEHSYFHSKSCVILYTICSCVACPALDLCLQYQEGGYYLWRCRESNLHLYNSIGLNIYIIRLVSASFVNSRLL
jgi:hypothetical protein